MSPLVLAWRGICLLLLCSGASLSTTDPAGGADALLDEARLRAFLQESQYTPGPVAREQSGITPSTSELAGKPCTIRMLYPRRGYQGDTTSSPRLRRADASASFAVTGAACVSGLEINAGEDGGGAEGETADVEQLVEGMELRVLVDGVEEAATQSAAIELTLPDLSSGNHVILAQVVMTVGQGRERALVALSEEIVILQDIEILFPSNDFVFEKGKRIVLAIGVSPTALERFCAPPSHMFEHCKSFDKAGTAVGVLIELNDNKASEFDMKPEDGDDGRRVYHVDVTDLPLGDFLLAVTLVGPSPADASTARDRVGEPSFVSFQVAECARNGYRCDDGVSSQGEGEGDMSNMAAGGGYGDQGNGHDLGIALMPPKVFPCPALAEPLCEAGAAAEPFDAPDGSCSGHGECVRGVCLCRGDWIGTRCQHSLLSGTLYMPAENPATWSGRCEQGQWWLSGQRALLHHIGRLHSFARCTEKDMMVFATRMHGLGAQMHYMTECLTTALQAGKGMLVGGNRSRPISCQRSSILAAHELARELFTCYLEPLADCPVSPLRDAADVEESDGRDMSKEGWGWGAPAEPVANNSRYTGDVFQQEPKGSAFWWRSQLASILLRPRAVVDAALQLLKASLNLRGGVISVHVRHGDACMHASISRFRPQCVPWGAYLERIYQMRDQYGVDRVFLATDDEEVAAAAAQVQDLHISQLGIDRSIFDADWFLEFRSELGLVDAQSVTESALLDLLLLSEGSYFVGYFPPYASVDYPWCFHMMHKGEVPGFGLVNC